MKWSPFCVGLAALGPGWFVVACIELDVPLGRFVVASIKLDVPPGLQDQHKVHWVAATEGSPAQFGIQLLCTHRTVIFPPSQ